MFRVKNLCLTLLTRHQYKKIHKTRGLFVIIDNCCFMKYIARSSIINSVVLNILQKI